MIDTYETKVMYPRNPVVLYRKGQCDQYDGVMEQRELKAIDKHFQIFYKRSDVFARDMVVGRYSVLPNYKELEDDLKTKGAVLINSYAQHCYIADLQNWYADIKGYTAKTWFSMDQVPDNVGPVVVKGETNSRKDKWDTHMFAANKEEAVQVMIRLMDDSLFRNQRIYIREFLPLETLMVSPCRNLPITLEYRFFCYGETILSAGYYWSSHLDDVQDKLNPTIEPGAYELVRQVLQRVKDKLQFVVVDVAKTKNGTWVVIELNDGQMSGLSENDPDVLYKNLKKALWP